MKLTYYYSACVGIETGRLSILCDPWFTDGIYDGSWYTFPGYPDALERLPAYDYVFISHIHPDHYDPVFLKQYLKRHPRTRLVIADFKHNYLRKKMYSDGFLPTQIYRTSSLIDVIAEPSGFGVNDIDSALIVRSETQAIVNMNDCTYNPEQVSRIKKAVGDREVLLLTAYTGAGSYPQCYFEDEPLMRSGAAHKKQVTQLEQYFQYIRTFEPIMSVPFAGEYILAGKRAKLNQYRGVVDALDAKALDYSNRTVVLDTEGSIDTTTWTATSERTHRNQDRVLEVSKDKSNVKYTYETKRFSVDPDLVPYARLLFKSYENAKKKSECMGTDARVSIRIDPLDKWFTFLVDVDGKVNPELVSRLPKEEGLHIQIYDLDPRYLYGLLTGVFHWNNAEVGSHYMTRRIPNVYKQKVHAFLNFFSVV